MKIQKIFWFLSLLLFLQSSVWADVLASTYNIKWLGYSKKRDNAGIATFLAESQRSLILVQEIVAPPQPVDVGGDTIKGDLEVNSFFAAMYSLGYEAILSQEDTGTGVKNHINAAKTEWFVAFYNPMILKPINHGFISEDRSDNLDYERVPYQFTFKELSSGMDFTVVSTHLKPNKDKASKERRYHELDTIISWVKDKEKATNERDYIILGDMNVYDCNTLDSHLHDGFKRANTECLNSNLKMTEPYDQVLYTDYSHIKDYQVVDTYKVFHLDHEMKSKDVIAKYSDHHPIFFTIISEKDDD